MGTKNKKLMNKTILIFIVLVAAIFIAFIIIGLMPPPAEITEPREPEPPAQDEELSFNDIWNAYLVYLFAIDERNIEKLAVVLYKAEHLPKYFDGFPDEEKEFWDTMDFIMEEWGAIIEKEDIDEVWKDRQQAIISTAIKETAEGNFERIQLFFVRSPAGEIIFLTPRRFSALSKQGLLDSDKDGRPDVHEDCSDPIYELYPVSCIKTDPKERDTDGDGWWDGIEVEAGRLTPFISDTDPNDPNDYPFKY